MLTNTIKNYYYESINNYFRNYEHYDIARDKDNFHQHNVKFALKIKCCNVASCNVVVYHR